MRRIIRLIIATPLVLVAVAAATTAAVPALRHMASGLWNVPDRLPALPGNSQVHFQQGAEDYAHAVSALLPAAIARIEAVHGRAFAHPVTVGVYATPEAFASATGVASSRPIGVTFFRRVILSPPLYTNQRQRLPGILTHELSHAHIQSWMSVNAYVHLPNWFKEGLAVMASGGGGAEFVNEEEAWAAIQREEHILINDAGSLLNLSEVRFEQAQAGTTSSHPFQLAYRQAGMFVAYLHDSDGAAFARMMNAILDGRSFVEAVSVGYDADVQSLWRKFVVCGANTQGAGGSHGLRKP
jgi:hypothetical protein